MATNKMMAAAAVLALAALGAGAAPITSTITTTAAAAAATTTTKLAVGINVDIANPGGYPSGGAVNATGAGWVRVEFKDAGTDGPIAAATWAAYDAAVAAYGGAGVRVLLILDYMTYGAVPWGSTDNDTWNTYLLPSSAPTCYVCRVAAVAAHYAGNGAVGGYELWNEPDLAATAVPTFAYATLAAAATSAIHAAAPGVPVVMGGLASGNPGYVTAVAAAAGGTLPVDAIGLHPYGQRPTPDWPTSTWGFGVVTDLMASYVLECTTRPAGCHPQTLPPNTTAQLLCGGGAAAVDHGGGHQ